MAMKALFPEAKVICPSLFIGMGAVGVGEITVPLLIELGHTLVTALVYVEQTGHVNAYPDPVRMYAEASVPILVWIPRVSVE